MHQDHRAPLIVAGVFFSLLALLHVLRLFMGWGIIIGTFSIPVWWSVIGFIIAAILAIWMFKSCCCSVCSTQIDK